MILVTGATGAYGKSAIEHLLQKGIQAENILALVRDESKAEDLKSLGVTLRKGNYNDYDSLVNAFEGVDKLLFVSSSEIENRDAQHKNVVDAVKQVGINHTVYTSFIRNTEVENSAIAFLQDSHLKTENWLKESGLNYTILQNAAYLENLPLFVGEKVLETGAIVLPAKDGKSNSVLRSELAEVAAHVLTTEGHENKVYPLTNTEAHSYEDVAQVMTEITGKQIAYQSPEADAYQKMMKDFGVPDEIIGLLTTFSVAQANGELELADGTLENFLGRKPTTLKQFLGAVYGSNA